MKQILEDFLLLLQDRLDPHSRAKQIDDTIVVFFEKLSKQPLKFILEIIKNYVIKNIGKNFLRFELFFNPKIYLVYKISEHENFTKTSRFRFSNRR